MMEIAQMDISEILCDLQGNAPLLGTHKKRIEEIMRHFQAAGLTLATCADARHLCRSVSTLKGYARDFGLIFPDYCPLALRPPKPKKEKKRNRKAA